MDAKLVEEFIYYYASVSNIVRSFFDGDERLSELWMNIENPILGKVKPVDMCLNGRGKKLLKIVRNLVKENKL